MLIRDALLGFSYTRQQYIALGAFISQIEIVCAIFNLNSFYQVNRNFLITAEVCITDKSKYKLMIYYLVLLIVVYYTI